MTFDAISLGAIGAVVLFLVVAWLHGLYVDRAQRDGSWIRHGTDVYVSTGDAKFRIFDPPPWRIDPELLWFVWYKRRESGTITIYVGEQPRTVRVRRV